VHVAWYWTKSACMLPSVNRSILEPKVLVKRCFGMWCLVVYQITNFPRNLLPVSAYEGREISVFENVGTYLLSYTASQSRLPQYSFWPPWEPHILYTCSFTSKLSGQYLTILTTWIRHTKSQKYAKARIANQSKDKRLPLLGSYRRFTWWLSQAVKINNPLLIAIKNHPTQIYEPLKRALD
jgi:hypothetical protein